MSDCEVMCPGKMDILHDDCTRCLEDGPCKLEKALLPVFENEFELESYAPSERLELLKGRARQGNERILQDVIENGSIYFYLDETKLWKHDRNFQYDKSLRDTDNWQIYCKTQLGMSYANVRFYVRCFFTYWGVSLDGLTYQKARLALPLTEKADDTEKCRILDELRPLTEDQAESHIKELRGAIPHDHPHEHEWIEVKRTVCKVCGKAQPEGE